MAHYSFQSCVYNAVDLLISVCCILFSTLSTSDSVYKYSIAIVYVSRIFEIVVPIILIDTATNDNSFLHHPEKNIIIPTCGNCTQNYIITSSTTN